MEMGSAGDIVWISMPFVAGVSITTLLSGMTAPPAPVPGVMLLLSAAALTLCCSRRSNRLYIALLFFLTGCFCSLNGMLVHTGSGQSPQGLNAISRLIENSGYAHSRTSSLVQALLTGRKSGLEQHTREIFRSSGASHLLALSGLHLGVIYLLLGRVLAVMGRGRIPSLIRSIAIISVCGVYSYLTGASPSIVRAFIFIFINELASLKAERRRNPLCTFCAAATLQLSVNPMLISSASFQLSYLAMLGIILLFPILDRWYPETGRHDPMRRVWTSMAMSISCQLFTAPIVWLRFGSFPTHFLLTNLLAMPLTEAIIVLSAVSVALLAAGMEPHALVGLTDRLSTLLLESLETISSM